MINLGTFIISCVLSAFVGYSIGETVGYNRYKKQTEEIKDYYYKCTNKLVDYIAYVQGKEKGGD